MRELQHDHSARPFSLRHRATVSLVHRLLLTLLVAASLSPLRGVAEESADAYSKPESRTEQVIEGFHVFIDDRLLTPNNELGIRAKRLLESRLYEITLQLPASAIEKLRTVKIYLDQSHGDLKSAQYHPSRAWLEGHGYSAELTRSVHIPLAERFASPRTHHVQPWIVLHELAHAYHDQFLDGGFGNAEIKAAWNEAKETGRYTETLHIDGRRTRHYALTDAKEFFAEMTEAYWGRNDFYPFVRGELKEDNPTVLRLIERAWTQGSHQDAR